MTDARTLTLALRGHWYGRYGLARCPAHGDRRPSLSLGTSANGRLLLHCFTGCDFRDVVDALRGLGLLEGTGGPVRMDRAALARREAEERAEARRQTARAMALWQEAQPIAGTPAQAYLLGRGITCALPPTLRFAPACWHPTAHRLPALVAQVEGGESFAAHRTYVSPDGAGKADVDPAKAMLGAVAGGAVRLSKDSDRLVVGEGVETGLSLLCGLLDGPATVWAALSTSGLRGLRLPVRPGQLTVAPDGDAPGRAAAQALATRAHGLGWTVSLLVPPDGWDFNDVLQGRTSA